MRRLATHATVWVRDDDLLAVLSAQERAALRTRVLMGQLLKALEHEEALAKPAAPPATPPS
jgi:hypothetical protein